MALTITEQERLRYLQLKRKKAMGSVQAQPMQVQQESKPNYSLPFAKIGQDIVGEIPKAGRTLTAIGQMPYTIGKDIYETGKGVVETIQGKQTPGQLGQRLGSGIIGSAKAIVEPYTNPRKFLDEQGALASFMAWYPGVKGLQTTGKALGKVASNVTVDTLSGAYGVPKEFIKKRLVRSKEIQSAPTREEFAMKLPEIGDKIQGEIAQLNAVGNQVLKTEKNIPTSNVLSSIGRIKSSIGKPVTSADLKLAKELNTIENNIIEFGDTLSEAELKTIITKIDDSINWGQEGAGQMNNALQSLRVSIDNQLKSRNPMYRKIMIPESDLIGLSKEFQRNLNLQKEVGDPTLKPGNITQDKITQAANPKNMATRRTLKKIGDYIGEDLLQQIDDVNVKHQFEVARPQGSKRTVIGGALGTGVGLIGEGLGLPRGVATGVGTSAGALAGSTMDTGGPALAKMIDRWATFREKPLGNTRGNVLLGKGNQLESEALKYKTPEEFVKAQQPKNIKLVSAKQSKDYMGGHEAPMAEDINAPIWDLTGKHTGKDLYPEDIYSADASRLYSSGMDTDPQAISILQSVKGRPNAKITIYRAVPKDIKGDINAGDWVTLTKEYAKTHGEGNINGEFKIIKKEVFARDIFTDANSIQEFGYDPQPRLSPQETPYELLSKAYKQGKVDLHSGYQSQLTDIWNKAHGKLVYKGGK